MKLCINCDDFGLSEGINSGFVEFAEAGIVKSCSVMSRHAPSDSIRKLNTLPHISVGLHFCLTDPAKNQPVIAHSPFTFLVGIISGRITKDIILKELHEQYRLLTDTYQGKITHIDTHQHIHIIPFLGRILEQFARDNDIPYVRHPREISRQFGLKKTILNLGFTTTQPEPAFWGTSFMGKRFTENAILNQIDYLLERGTEKSIWMIHPGYQVHGSITDPYNKNRENELKVLRRIAPSLSGKVKLVSMHEIL